MTDLYVVPQERWDRADRLERRRQWRAVQHSGEDVIRLGAALAHLLLNPREMPEQTSLPIDGD